MRIKSDPSSGVITPAAGGIRERGGQGYERCQASTRPRNRVFQGGLSFGADGGRLRRRCRHLRRSRRRGHPADHRQRHGAFSTDPVVNLTGCTGSTSSTTLTCSSTSGVVATEGAYGASFASGTSVSSVTATDDRAVSRSLGRRDRRTDVDVHDAHRGRGREWIDDERHERQHHEFQYVDRCQHHGRSVRGRARHCRRHAVATVSGTSLDAVCRTDDSALGCDARFSTPQTPSTRLPSCRAGRRA